MLEKGKRVGEYVLLEKLGAGGFGEVWKAEKRTEFSTSYFAIKFFRPKDDEEIDVSAVKREVGTWQSLNGLPNIISVIEANRFEDYVYIVSEFAEGGSLDRWLKANGGKAHSTEEAVKITQQILQGLEGMHGEGFVHRDLKPANVLLKRNIFYLADFGISRQMKTHSKTTGTAGTYEFMPPEAFEKNPSVSVHTDIWAAGAILQKLLTGHLPFPQDEIPSLMAAILMSEPEPLPETVPFELRGIVKKALQKKREDRFQSANEMREALQNALNPPKFVEVYKSLPVETLVLEDSDKTAKLETALTEKTQPIIKANERETELRSIQTEIKTAFGQQIREASEQIGEETDKTKKLILEPIKDWRKVEAEETKRQKAYASVAKRFLETRDAEKEQSAEEKNRKTVVAISIVALGIVILGGLIWAASSNLPSNVATNKAANTVSTSSNNPNNFKNSIGMVFVKIPAGSFMMGSDKEDYEKPAHKVTILNDFYMGKYEVTQSEWKAIMGSNPSNFKGDNLPVENVSWEDAQEFIKKLNAKDEGTYRLPTEAEWEYAARAGTTGDYYGNLDSIAWYNANSSDKTHPVGRKQANAFGLYDMSGNVWEWAADWYGAYSSGAVTNPTGATTGSYRVIRGGSWNFDAENLRSAYRRGSPPSNRFNGLGFRVVRN